MPVLHGPPGRGAGRGPPAPDPHERPQDRQAELGGEATPTTAAYDQVDLHRITARVAAALDHHDLAYRELEAAWTVNEARLGRAARFTCTFSAGVAELEPGDSLTQLLARADDLLYRAKAAGRNRVEAAGAASGG